MDRVGRSLRFCQLEFDKEVLSDGLRSEREGKGGGRHAAVFVNLFFISARKFGLMI